MEIEYELTDKAKAIHNMAQKEYENDGELGLYYKSKEMFNKYFYPAWKKWNLMQNEMEQS